MNATKRKFNALLNGLGNKSTTNLVTPVQEPNNGPSLKPSAEVNEPDPQAKRRRISQPSSLFSRASSSTRYNPLIVQRKPASTITATAAGHAAVDAPKYAPWDRAAFLARLKSFSNITDWTPKPSKVNEVEWAKRGWVCQKFERVRCCFCNVEILVKLNKKEVDGKEEHVLVSSMIEEALVNKYSDMIVTAHAEHCLWRQRGCDDSIFKLSLNHAPTTLHYLRERYDGLCDLGELLPYMHNIHPPEDLDLDAVITFLSKDFFAAQLPKGTETCDEVLSPEPNRIALIMALCGWRNRVGHMPKHGAVVCDSCFRTLGLWLFKTRDVTEAGEILRPASMNWLDPINEHREYCPWRNPNMQSGESTDNNSLQTPQLAAWQVIIRVLRNDQYLKSKAESQVGAPKKALPTSQKAAAELDADIEDDEASRIREEKDKERWARLRRVRSLFEMKSKKGQRSSMIAETKSSGVV
ncbi:MAG: hypothetical protein M1818_006078 [Claussenomyces sp. TS43310]|nr:MAG: hypothetical protein M1818_006078 [Claussenomyces sp. TS43310]